uniref:Uncharacterized protein n=1 Tax=Chromera velia CCMP2878 TaxID=1169474 RepID=A0A0G4FYM3_9ALVE|eukprot:Cvel_3914.t1-p1 / transcript=Cvel_3914.t1 / gene=Cvel_3914 / organism=Chromera_velia_CCMP2878 / gene_product=hypothetical protein / transcript_product=hypothetical protein / location=Cvel_scaffold166:25233-27059(+) / protein_length=609 / sequence_SO=supercontig / SO=protein_coding / is_pseudo=false
MVPFLLYVALARSKLPADFQVLSRDELEWFASLCGYPDLVQTCNMSAFTQTLNCIGQALWPGSETMPENPERLMFALKPYILADIAEPLSPSASPDTPQDAGTRTGKETVSADPWGGADGRVLTPPPVSIDCASPKFSRVLDGSPLSSVSLPPRLIVDFIMFGWDVHLLEVRLLELFDVVDLFFIQEAPEASQGWMKPLLLVSLFRQERFKRFRSKVILNIPEETDRRVTRRQRQMLFRVGFWKRQGDNSYVIEKEWRSEIVNTFRSLLYTPEGRLSDPMPLAVQVQEMTSTPPPFVRASAAALSGIKCFTGSSLQLTERHECVGLPVLEQIRERMKKFRKGQVEGMGVGTGRESEKHTGMNGKADEVLGIASDADEIPKREAVAHVRNCLFRPPPLPGTIGREGSWFPFPLLFPAVLQKVNFDWFFRRNQMMEEAPGFEEYPQVREFLWRMGPFVSPMAFFFSHRSILRYETGRFLKHTGNHVGLGAGTHLSSQSEPASTIMKAACAADESYDGALSRKLIRMSGEGSLTASDAVAELTWECRHKSELVHKVQLDPLLQRLFPPTVPWAVLTSPRRFCFQSGGSGLSDEAEFLGPLARTKDPHLLDEC